MKYTNLQADLVEFFFSPLADANPEPLIAGCGLDFGTGELYAYDDMGYPWVCDLNIHPEGELPSSFQSIGRI